MANIITARNTRLAVVAEGESLAEDFRSDIIDFKEMRAGSVQVVRTGGDKNDGDFIMYVSNLCAEDTFALYPGSEINKKCDGQNLIWMLNDIPFRYAQIRYTAKTDTTGAATIYARGKL